jgi:hypothetical protein
LYVFLHSLIAFSFQLDSCLFRDFPASSQSIRLRFLSTNGIFFSAVPITFKVERIRSGHTFATRHVQAIQKGKVCFAMYASFQVTSFRMMNADELYFSFISSLVMFKSVNMLSLNQNTSFFFYLSFVSLIIFLLATLLDPFSPLRSLQNSRESKMDFSINIQCHLHLLRTRCISVLNSNLMSKNLWIVLVS